ncbi:MAG TPA: hypothetical protein VMW54_12180 [Terriglobia bacterium]|nr:hypothetical protein [Terriglobia bacterium]
MAYFSTNPEPIQPPQTLGNLTTLTDTRNLLSESLPIWQTLLLGIGGLALLIWGADLVKREAKKARKSLGV